VLHVQSKKIVGPKPFAELILIKSRC